MIITKSVVFEYDEKHQFHFPDISCEAAKTLVISGQSGVGKTTFLHLLAGIIQPNAGQIIIDGVDISELSPKKVDAFRGKNIGLILQQSHFVNALTVKENLELVSWLALGKKLSIEADELLKELDIFGHKNKLTNSLSVGQQQRLSIARALITRPKLLLADEPTSSLDDENTKNVAQLLQNLASKYQTALIVVTHDLRLKNIFSNHIILEKYVG